MLDSDERTAVPAATRNVGIATQYFDPDMVFGAAFAASIGLGRPVFDIYAFYAPGAGWTDGPPRPEIAIGKLGGVVVATPGVLPALADQSKLLPQLRGHLEVVAATQPEFDALFDKLARQFAAKYPATPR
ncbi:MAG: hypothetical protein AB7P03_15545 [Kofleriaceae bacterium]